MKTLQLMVSVDVSNDPDGELAKSFEAFMKAIREMIDIGTPYASTLFTVNAAGIDKQLAP